MFECVRIQVVFAVGTDPEDPLTLKMQNFPFFF